MFDFRMPALGADMEKGILSSWHVKPGDAVKKGDVVADVETDKGTIAVEIWEPGEVTDILVAEGREVPVGSPLARLKAPGETPPSPPLHPQEAVVEAPSVEHPRPHVRASPLARKIAHDLGVDLEKVRGSGPDGAITQADVENFAPESGEPQRKATPEKVAASEDRLTAMRRAIGQAMSRSKREIPHYYLKADVRMATPLVWLRDANARRPVTNRILPIALNLKAISRALKKTPALNGHFVDGTFQPHESIHLGVAITIRGGGLVAPAILDADRKSLDELMAALADLVLRARSGKLKASEVSGPTITVTNLGDSAADAVFGVIHPPQVAMIGLGRITERPWAENGMIGSRETMTVTLSGDHRVSDGHQGALFLGELSRILQDPKTL